MRRGWQDNHYSKQLEDGHKAFVWRAMHDSCWFWSIADMGQELECGTADSADDAMRRADEAWKERSKR